MKTELQDLLILLDDSIRKAIVCIDRGRGGEGIALVVDAERRLVGTITDGDVRRAMLADIALNAPVRELLEWKAGSPDAAVVTALVGTSPELLVGLMKERSVRQVPLLNGQGRLEDLATLGDLLPGKIPRMEAVIMAGGMGTRLRPLTNDIPKPMVEVGGRPLLEHLLHQLQQAGIREVNVTTHYKSEKIIDHFGDGRSFGVNLTYVKEDRPLGTAGALGLMPHPEGTQLVINGDILTNVDFQAMLVFHQTNSADMTIALRRYEVPVPYGVVECEGIRVSNLAEKPQLSCLINTGVYLLEPSVHEFIPKSTPFNMTDLIRWLLDAGRMVIGFPIRKYWLDVGRLGDYKQAQDDMRNGRIEG